MSAKKQPNKIVHFAKYTSRKNNGGAEAEQERFATWMQEYQRLAVVGVRSAAVAHKISLHLERFRQFFLTRYGHERVATCLRRDVHAWQTALRDDGLAPSTINNHLASLSAFTTWVHAQAPDLFAVGDPAKGIRVLGLPPLEPRALTADQVRSLKSLCDRLPRLHQGKGRQWTGTDAVPVKARGRPWRDRAIVFVLLSTGLRREELVRLDLINSAQHIGRTTNRAPRPAHPRAG